MAFSVVFVSSHEILHLDSRMFDGVGELICSTAALDIQYKGRLVYVYVYYV